jgi:hypothetical protein
VFNHLDISISRTGCKESYRAQLDYSPAVIEWGGVVPGQLSPGSWSFKSSRSPGSHSSMEVGFSTLSSGLGRLRPSPPEKDLPCLLWATFQCEAHAGAGKREEAGEPGGWPFGEGIPALNGTAGPDNLWSPSHSYVSPICVSWGREVSRHGTGIVDLGPARSPA